jgi:uncharacterized repeat protein (TIGR01451 family)
MILRGWYLLFAALLAMCAAAPASAQTTTQYTNTSSQALVDGSCSVANTRTKTFAVSTSYIISDIDIGVLISHAYRSDVRLTLTSPAGTSVTVLTWAGNVQSGDNYSDLFDDEAATSITSHNATVTDPTSAPGSSYPYYSHAYRPSNPLNAFDGENASGTWTLSVCDAVGGDTGTFQRADLFITSAPASYADLSLTKTVSNAAPTSGASISYTLAVTNSSSSTSAASSVTVLDQLPVGVSFTSAAGFGSYNSSTGVWTVGSIPAGTTRTITITVTVTAGVGTTIQNGAEVMASSVVDLDSVPNNDSTVEDDDAFASFTTTGTRTAGTPPTLICPNGTTLLDWNAQSWTSGSSTGTANVANIGAIGINVTTQGTFTVPLQLNATITGGLTGQNSLYQNVEYTTRAQTTTTTVTLPTAVPGTQFTIFDVDYAVNDFADKMTITGSYNGSPVSSPTLTNGVSNYVFGNVAIGDVTASDTTNQGNVVVTFAAPVDTITIVYGNHSTAPADPDGQAIAINDFTFCNPQTTLSVTKISSVISDGVSGTNPKAVPGAVMQYCILVSNSGSATAANVAITDVMPANVTFVPASIRSGTNCAGATTVEDDDATGADETPVGASFTATTLTGTATSLGPAASFAIAFNATVN